MEFSVPHSPPKKSVYAISLFGTATSYSHLPLIDIMIHTQISASGVETPSRAG